MRTLRILMVSKFKTFQGGVERHLFDLADGLRAKGHVVDIFSSEDVTEVGGSVFDKSAAGAKAKIVSIRDLMWNRRAGEELQKKVLAFEPDVIHYHSIYHQLSPSVLRDFGVATVMTLHDYKLAAPCYTLYRDGEVCTLCVGNRLPLAGVKYKCVGGSAIASAVCATEHLIHQTRYVHSVDHFIVPSEYSRRVMEQAGIPTGRISTVAWGVNTASLPPEPHRSLTRTVAFVGRLHPTKGVVQMLDAWDGLPKDHTLRLVIAGVGELQDHVVEASQRDSTIDYAGFLDADGAASLITEADIALVPSLFPETMGLSALECLVAGTPIISSNRGALSDLSGPGVLDLAEVTPEGIGLAIASLYDAGGATLRRMRSELATRDLSNYTHAAMIERVLDVYLRTMRGRSASNRREDHLDPRAEEFRRS